MKERVVSKVKDLLYSSITNKECDLEGADALRLYQIVKAHRLTSFCAKTFLKCEGTSKTVAQDFMLDVHRETVFEEERAKISCFMKNESIDFLFLKGAILRDFYPSKEMRSMNDIDLLIKKQDEIKVKEKFLSNGYHQGEGSERVLVFLKEPFINVEVHTSLFDEDDFTKKENEKLTRDIFLNAKKKEEELVLSDFDFYLHVVLHAVKHLKKGGVGLRSLLDIYYLDKNVQVDKERLTKTLKKYGALKAYEVLLLLANKIASNQPFTEEELIIFEFLIKSGSFGRVRIDVAKNSTKGKGRYLLRRFFIPYSEMKKRYKILKYLPILLPIFWVVRGFSALTNKRVKKELEATKTLRKEEIEETKKIYQILGL